MDDLLKSFETTGEAVQITKQLQELRTRGGFKLTKFTSNARGVLGGFRPEDRTPTVKNLDFKFDSLPVDHAYGIHWNVEDDTFNLVTRFSQKPAEAPCLRLLQYMTLLVMSVHYFCQEGR